MFFAFRRVPDVVAGALHSRTFPRPFQASPQEAVETAPGVRGPVRGACGGRDGEGAAAAAGSSARL